MDTTETEFDPQFYRSLFEENPEEWQEFVTLSIRTFHEGVLKVDQAAKEGNMALLSETRHSLSPALQQWGTLQLNQHLLALKEDDLQGQWAVLRTEFDDLIACLKRLQEE